MTIDCDVLVVGAGPVGNTAAISAAKEGLKVVSIDRKLEIASPLRGGEAVCKPFFDELDTELNLLDKVPKKEVKGTLLRGGKCKIIDKEDKWKAYVVERAVMEKLLAENAIDAGVDLRLGSELVSVSGSNRGISSATVRTIEGIFEINPEVVIAADGFASFFRRYYKLDKPVKDWASAIELEMAGIDFYTDELLQVFFEESIAGGYTYVFPKSGSRGLTGVAMRPFFGAKESALEMFWRLKKSYSYLETQLRNAHAIEIRGGCIDVSGPLKELVYGNVMMAGDAANQNFAYIGEGLIPGMTGALLAGKKAALAIEKGDLTRLNEYPKEYEATSLWKELVQTWSIKEKIDSLYDKSIPTDLKLAITCFLEMEIIDWTGKELSAAFKITSLKELLSWGQELADAKSMKCEITEE
jgi:digeranylgeranylglycerophospholipid reductase